MFTYNIFFNVPVYRNSTENYKMLIENGLGKVHTNKSPVARTKFHGDTVSCIFHD